MQILAAVIQTIIFRTGLHDSALLSVKKHLIKAVDIFVVSGTTDCAIRSRDVTLCPFPHSVGSCNITRQRAEMFLWCVSKGQQRHVMPTSLHRTIRYYKRVSGDGVTTVQLLHMVQRKLNHNNFRAEPTRPTLLLHRISVLKMLRC